MKLKLLTATVLIFLIGMQLNAIGLELSSEIDSNSLSTHMNLSALTPHDGIVIDGDSDLLQQAIDEGWPGNGTEENPIVMSGYSFNLFGQAIRIFHTTLYWEFRDNVIEGTPGSQCGTWVINTTHGAFINNEFFNRAHSGIYVEDVFDLIISGNYIHDCGTHAIEAVDLLTNCIIENNIFEDNDEMGMSLMFGLVNSEISNNTILNSGGPGISIGTKFTNSTMMNNDVQQSGDCGIYISKATDSSIIGNIVTQSSDDGIKVSTSESVEISDNIVNNSISTGINLLHFDNSEVMDNQISNSNEFGLHIDDGSTFFIQNNTINSSIDYGLSLGDSTTGATVEMNQFYQNGDDCQLLDDGTGNSISRNYYDDWNTPDADENGFVDIPYSIDGIGENRDEFPLADPNIIPDIPNTGDSTTPTDDTTFPLSNEMLAVIIAGSVGVIIIVAIVVKKRT